MTFRQRVDSGQGSGEASRRYRQLFYDAPDGLLSTDLRGNIRDANRAAARLLGSPRSDLMGRSLASFVSRGQRRSFRARLGKLRAGGARGIEEWQVQLQPPGGEPIETALAIAPVNGSARGRARLLCAVRDITRRKRIERRLKERERQYRNLYRQMLSHRDALRILSARYLHAREEEAKRIAHQLHDEAGQITASIHLALAEIGRELPAPGRERLQQVTASLDEFEEGLRRLSHELRPTILDDLGLRPALEFLAEGFSARTGIAIRVEGTAKRRVNPLVETAIYRVVQEALANIARHSSAGHASIELTRERACLLCTVRDDGVGFDPDLLLSGDAGRRGLGLLGVRERLDALGGRIQIRSAPGTGTELSVAVPLRRRS
ncbi:MAG TPA: PAS domain-containing sensor histidine kinase [Thermoanaerobaculia bacterium]|jgi:PAS domain S-box-containing protein